MPIENRIRRATCRVDKDDNQLGTAFWVEEYKLITAAHVVEVFTDDSVDIRTTDDETISCEVEYSNLDTEDDPGTDLAVLESQDMPDEYETLPVNSDIPSIGTEVVWSGYARLFGESKIDRQRFGWGQAASEKYGENDAEFFEVDGLFNPSHSGGPVVSKETEQVVGVVSASAGGFDNLEEAWQTRSELLTGAFDIYEMATGDSGWSNTLETPDPETAARVQNLFDRIGVDYNVDVEDGDVKITFFREEIPGRAGVVLSQMAQLLLDTARSTFQMGVGIATGGQPLNDLT